MTSIRRRHILETLEAADAKFSTVGLFPEPDGILHASTNLKPNIEPMTKSFDVISEAVRDPRHPFRKVDNQPKKPRKHRYERRKIKGFLHLGDWATGEAT